MAYPTDIENSNAGVGATGQPLSNPNHITQHNKECDIIDALQAKVGANSSAVTTSHDYKLSGVTGTDKAVSLTGNETLTTKTLTSPTLTTPKINLGSDATGDIYYRHSDGTLKRLGIGTANYILNVNSGVPAWREETSVADASTTAKGVVEEATLAEIDAGTATGGTSARLFVNPSTLGKSTDGTLADNSDAKIPSQKAVKTYVDAKPHTWKNGVSTRDMTAVSGSQNIAHGLGRTPVFVRITAFWGNSSAVPNQYSISSIGTYNGSATATTILSFNNGSSQAISATDTTNIINLGVTSGQSQVATIAVDGTNITLTWTKEGSPTGSSSLMWEAY